MDVRIKVQGNWVEFEGLGSAHTLLDTVLLRTLVVGVFLLGSYALNALIVVVLVGGALGGVGAICLLLVLLRPLDLRAQFNWLELD